MPATYSYNKAVILGLAGVTSLGLIHSLSEKGVEIHGINIDRNKGLSYYSKYLKNKYFQKGGYSEEELLALIKSQEDLHYSYIFASNDRMVLFLSTYSSQLRSMNIIGTDCILSGEEMLNKELIRKKAQLAGFNVPKTYSNINEIKTDSSEYPVIIKPINCLRFNKKDSRIVRNYDELIHRLPQNWQESFIIEEYIEGETGRLIEIYGFRNSSGETHIPCMIQKLRQHPSINGTGTYARTEYYQELIKPVKTFVDQIQYVGLFNIEVKYSVDSDRYYFIETNFRAGAQIHLSTKAGVNIPYGYMNGDADHSLRCRNGLYWFDLLDFKNINRTITLKRIIRDFLKSDCHAGFKLNDPKHLLMYIFLHFRKHIKDLYISLSGGDRINRTPDFLE